MIYVVIQGEYFLLILEDLSKTLLFLDTIFLLVCDISPIAIHAIA